MEIWKDFNGYRISNEGKIVGKSGKVLKPTITKSRGYCQIGLCIDGKQINFYVHRLVLELFVGKSNLTCNHKNGIKTDNRVDNLEWVTKSFNTKHAHEKGMINNKGERCHWCKLTESQARRIKFVSKNIKVEIGYWSKVAKALNVNRSSVWAIVKGKSWRHV